MRKFFNSAETLAARRETAKLKARHRRRVARAELELKLKPIVEQRMAELKLAELYAAQHKIDESKE